MGKKMPKDFRPSSDKIGMKIKNLVLFMIVSLVSSVAVAGGNPEDRVLDNKKKADLEIIAALAKTVRMTGEHTVGNNDAVYQSIKASNEKRVKACDGGTCYKVKFKDGTKKHKGETWECYGYTKPAAPRTFVLTYCNEDGKDDKSKADFKLYKGVSVSLDAPKDGAAGKSSTTHAE